jgi:hypothetical protein
MKLDDVKSKIQVQSERNIMIFYFMQNNDFIIEKYGQQGRLMQRFSKKVNVKKT